jgi:hypothetical protein
MLVKAVFLLAVIIGLPVIVTRYASVADKDIAKRDCQRIREAIDQFTADRRIAPKSEPDLVDAGYARNAGSTGQCQIVWQQDSN